MNGTPSSTWFTVAARLGLADRPVLLPRRDRRRQLLPRRLIDLFGGRTTARSRGSGYYIAFPCVARQRAAADAGPQPAGALLAHADPVRDVPADVQVLVADVGRLLGAALFGFFTFGVVSRRAGRGQADTLAGFSRLRPPASHWGSWSRRRRHRRASILAGYTGVLLTVTNRPIWSDTPLLGMLFLVSAASTSAALIMLLAYRSGLRMPALASLHRMDDWMIALELIVLIALVVSLGPVARAWMNLWGAFLALVIVVGNIVPLALSWRSHQGRWGAAGSGAAGVLGPQTIQRSNGCRLVLVGGFLLRLVIVFSAESV